MKDLMCPLKGGVVMTEVPKSSPRGPLPSEKPGRLHWQVWPSEGITPELRNTILSYGIFARVQNTVGLR